MDPNRESLRPAKNRLTNGLDIGGTESNDQAERYELSEELLKVIDIVCLKNTRACPHIKKGDTCRGQKGEKTDKPS